MTPKNAKWWKAGSEAVQTCHPINTNQNQSDQNQDDKLLKRIKGAKAVASQTSLLPSKISWYQLTALCLPNLKTDPRKRRASPSFPYAFPTQPPAWFVGQVHIIWYINFIWLLEFSFPYFKLIQCPNLYFICIPNFPPGTTNLGQKRLTFYPDRSFR